MIVTLNILIVYYILLLDFLLFHKIVHNLLYYNVYYNMVAIQYLSNVYKKCFCTSSKSHVLINNIEGNFKKGGDGGPNSFPFFRQ